MKKYIFSIVLLCSAGLLYAQTHTDALRYSQHTIGGSARSVAMGGAFGALGADFSTLSTNPAGVAVYRGSELTFSPEIFIAGTSSQYFGNSLSEPRFNVNLGNFGYVATFNEGDGLLKSASFGLGFNRLANFSRNTLINGDNPYTTYADYIAADATQFGIEDNYARFTSALFYDAWIIDDTDSPGSYYIAPEYLYDDGTFRATEQNYNTTEWGKINEWVFSLGFNFDNKLYFGGTFGIQPLSYEFEKNTTESDANERDYKYFDFFESLKVNGTGYNAKVGMIFKPIQMLRLGAAFHMPVTYHLNEQYTTSISSQYTEVAWQTLYPIDLSGNRLNYLENEYKVITPFKAIGSVGLVLGKLLILSSDLEYIDYSSMRLRGGHQDDFSDVNSDIREVYRDNINIKLGGEFRLGALYLRGGAGYYGSPYAKEQVNYNANKYSLSAGIGVREKSYFFDMALQHTFSEETTFMYGAYDGDGIWRDNSANIGLKTTRAVATIGFRF
ncbi:MAG: outer membrane protein transport protein [Bacteroidales bacterium]|nr:outer membrane protein transport protein [Bacteroidales bacterium]